MSQRTKNILLLVLLGFLILSSITLGLIGTTTTNTIENKEQFTVQDTSLVDQIKIISKEATIQLKKSESIWMLNDQYKAEQHIIKVLLSILKDMQVVRNVPKTQEVMIKNQIKDRGHLVEIYGHGKLIQSFYAVGNENKTVSYIMNTDDSQPYIVNIPGYESYVAGIFEISSNDWRDRTILSTNWRTLQKLTIDYSQFPEYNVAIKFDFNFLRIDGIHNLDTARMMSYIDEFNFLQTDRYLRKGQNTKYDSLLNTPKTVTIAIEDINADNSKTIDFYPLLSNDPMMLGYVRQDDQIVLFEAKRIQDLFAVKSDFEAKPNKHSD